MMFVGSAGGHQYSDFQQAAGEEQGCGIRGKYQKRICRSDELCARI